MMRRAGLSGWVIHLQRHFARRRKPGHLTAPLCFLLCAAATPKNSSKKFLFRHRQYVQLICVGHSPIMGAFCRAQKKTLRDSFSSFRTLAPAKQNGAARAKVVQIFFLIAKTAVSDIFPRSGIGQESRSWALDALYSET